MSDVTNILHQIEFGDPSATEQLLPLVNDELRKLAAARLAQEKPGQTIQATALDQTLFSVFMLGTGNSELSFQVRLKPQSGWSGIDYGFSF